MRYLEIARRGDHLEIRPPQRQTETYHRIQKRPGVARVTDGLAETIDRSEITGEPFEVPPAPGTGPVKKVSPKKVVSYGINDMDRARPS